MRRRVLVLRMALAALPGASGPACLRAQTSGRIPRLGVLRWGVEGDGFQQDLSRALAELGYREGHTVRIDWRWATRPDAARQLASELLALKPDLLMASGTPAAVILRDAARGVPLILGAVADPVGAGLVTSLARPGGTITGVSTNLPPLAAKQLQLIRETLPTLERVAFLGSTQDAATPLFVQELKAAAAALRIGLSTWLIRDTGEFEAAADGMARERAQAVVVQPIFTLGQSGALAQILNRQRLPSVSAFRDFAIHGGLMAYGASRSEVQRRAASFVDRVLKGAAPGTLPVEEPTVYELALNRSTARELGITIPSAMLRRADEVFG